MSLPTHWRSWLAVSVVVLILAWWLRPESVEVDTMQVSLGPLRETIDEEGETRVRDRYVVAAPVTGRLRRLELRVGDSVSGGQLVAAVEPAPLDTRTRRQASAELDAAVDARRAADAAVLAAEAALNQASRTRMRADTLAAQGHLAVAEREAAALQETTLRRQADATRAEAETAAHEVERARAALLAATGGDGAWRGRIPVRAPVSGRILRLLEESERVVPAGTPLLEIGNPSALEVVADLLSTDAVKVRPGDTVLVEAWGGGDTLRARVRTVEPSGFTKTSALGVEEQRVNIVADMVDPPGALGDRYQVEARVVLWGAARVLRVPLSALVRDGDRWSVYVVSGGRARARVVTPGHRGAFDVEVTEGLRPGETIIRYPSALIRDGIRVRQAAGR